MVHTQRWAPAQLSAEWKQRSARRQGCASLENWTQWSATTPVAPGGWQAPELDICPNSTTSAHLRSEIHLSIFLHQIFLFFFLQIEYQCKVLAQLLSWMWPWSLGQSKSIFVDALCMFCADITMSSAADWKLPQFVITDQGKEPD